MFQGGTSAAVRDDHDRSQSSGVRRATSEDMPLVDVLAGPSGRSDARRGHHLTRNTLSRSARRCRLSKSATKSRIELKRRKRNVDIPRFFSSPIPARGAFVADLDAPSLRAAPGAPPAPPRARPSPPLRRFGPTDRRSRREKFIQPSMARQSQAESLSQKGDWSAEEECR